MSEGERVVYIDSQLPTRPCWDNDDYRDFYDRDVPFLLSVAKKVPALQARIAEQEKELEPYRKQRELIAYHFDPTKTVKMESSGDGIMFG